MPRYGAMGLLTLFFATSCARTHEFHVRPGEPVFPDQQESDAGSPFPSVGSDDFMLVAVSPNHGPFSGGEEVIVRGNAFDEDSWQCNGASSLCGTILFGLAAVDPQTIHYIDSHRISVRLPAGHAGPVDVTLTQNGQQRILAHGFSYDGFVIRPTSGGIGGGELVTVAAESNAFESSDQLRLGEAEWTPLTRDRGDLTFVAEVSAAVRATLNVNAVNMCVTRPEDPKPGRKVRPADLELARALDPIFASHPRVSTNHGEAWSVQFVDGACAAPPSGEEGL